MENSTTEQVKLSKHLSAAVNAIQKEIDKKANQSLKLSLKAQSLQHDAEILQEEMKGLQEQISKLKGE